VPVQPTIEGASSEQRRLLEEILASMESTRIPRIVIRPFVETSEEGDVPLPGDHGDEIFVDTGRGFDRGHWEAELLAVAFARRSKASRLRKVACFAFSDGAKTLEWAPPAVEPLTAEALARFESDAVRAAGDSRLESFDVLRPQGHAVALAIQVDEPHAFLRLRSREFLESVAAWRERCDGIYGEIRDEQPRAALTFGWFRHGGFSSIRPDVECCAPFLGMSHPIDWQGPPPCPLFD
jgi:hypothetical protein